MWNHYEFHFGFFYVYYYVSIYHVIIIVIYIYIYISIKNTQNALTTMNHCTLIQIVMLYLL